MYFQPLYRHQWCINLAIMKEVENQSLTEAFGFAHQKEKALNRLRGILARIVADEELNEKELLFLDGWLKISAIPG
ncbi:MAG TPA: hypothetical protein DCX09_05975 [Gammaproteobacteria bacterium]|nr:hypothetical protein [Gammaproteobacteria bacterium]